MLAETQLSTTSGDSSMFLIWTKLDGRFLDHYNTLLDIVVRKLDQIPGEPHSDIPDLVFAHYANDDLELYAAWFDDPLVYFVVKIDDDQIHDPDLYDLLTFRPNYRDETSVAVTIDGDDPEGLVLRGFYCNMNSLSMEIKRGGAVAQVTVTGCRHNVVNFVKMYCNTANNHDEDMITRYLVGDRA